MLVVTLNRLLYIGGAVLALALGLSLLMVGAPRFVSAMSYVSCTWCARSSLHACARRFSGRGVVARGSVPASCCIEKHPGCA